MATNQKLPLRNIDIASSTTVGIVKPDNSTIFIDSTGTIRAIGGSGSSNFTASKTNPTISTSGSVGDRIYNYQNNSFWVLYSITGTSPNFIYNWGSQKLESLSDVDDYERDIYNADTRFYNIMKLGRIEYYNQTVNYELNIIRTAIPTGAGSDWEYMNNTYTVGTNVSVYSIQFSGAESMVVINLGNIVSQNNFEATGQIYLTLNITQEAFNLLQNTNGNTMVDVNLWNFPNISSSFLSYGRTSNHVGFLDGEILVYDGTNNLFEPKDINQSVFDSIDTSVGINKNQDPQNNKIILSNGGVLTASFTNSSSELDVNGAVINGSLNITSDFNSIALPTDLSGYSAISYNSFSLAASASYSLYNFTNNGNISNGIICNNTNKTFTANGLAYLFRIVVGFGGVSPIRNFGVSVIIAKSTQPTTGTSLPDTDYANNYIVTSIASSGTPYASSWSIWYPSSSTTNYSIFLNNGSISSIPFDMSQVQMIKLK